MTKEDITRLAQEAGFVGMDGDHGALRRFADLVASAEREACANVAKRISDKYGFGHYGNEVDTADEIEAAIRARGDNK